MNVVVTGIVLGLAVSIPPGPNAVLCMNLACGGVRRAVPLITSAALTDAAYSLAAASGLLLVSRADAKLVADLAPCFMIGAAALAWSSDRISPRAAAGVALINPSTAAIWLGLSSVPALRVISLSDLLLRALPVALATAAWFTLLAATASKLSHRIGAEHTQGLRRALAVALGALGALSLIAPFA